MHHIPVIHPMLPGADATDQERSRQGIRHTKSIIFSSQVFDLEAIKRAAYRFCDVFSTNIFPRELEIECVLLFLKEQTGDECETVIAAFQTEVLDQDLRSKIAKETEGFRNAVLAYALSKTGLQSGE
jgi:His-Xaa-Ser system protein HxsD